jgi:hypothetical protein
MTVDRRGHVPRAFALSKSHIIEYVSRVFLPPCVHQNAILLDSHDTNDGFANVSPTRKNRNDLLNVRIRRTIPDQTISVIGLTTGTISYDAANWVE